MKSAETRFRETCHVKNYEVTTPKLLAELVDLVEREIDNAVADGRFSVSVDGDLLKTAASNVECYLLTPGERGGIFLTLGRKYERSGFSFSPLRRATFADGIEISWDW